MINKSMVVLIAIFSCSIQATEFTQKERDGISGLRLRIEDSCKMNLKSIPPAVGPEGAGRMLAWVNGLVDSPGYCSCLGQKFQEKMTPELLRSGSEQDGRNLMLNAGKLCMVEKLKTTAPNFCRAFIADMEDISRDPRETEGIQEVCSCVQDSIASIDAENFDEFTSQTVIDYEDYKKSGELNSTKSNSLLGAMNNCGIKKLKR